MPWQTKKEKQLQCIVSMISWRLLDLRIVQYFEWMEYDVPVFPCILTAQADHAGPLPCCRRDPCPNRPGCSEITVSMKFLCRIFSAAMTAC
jgi:hypothetical protein